MSQQGSSQDSLWQGKITGLLDSREFSDVTFIFTGDGEEKKSIKGHSLILALKNEVFKTMLYGPNFKETDERIVEITDVDADTFEALLKYLYSGEVSLNNAIQGLKLYIASDKYLIMELKFECTKFICERADSTEALHILEWAVDTDDTHLKDCLRNIVEFGTKQILACKEMLCIKPTTLKVLLSEYYLYIEQRDILLGVLRWCSHQLLPNLTFEGVCELVRSSGIAEHLNFSSMKTFEFVECFEKAGLAQKEICFNSLKQSFLVKPKATPLANQLFPVHVPMSNNSRSQDGFATLDIRVIKNSDKLVLMGVTSQFRDVTGFVSVYMKHRDYKVRIGNATVSGNNVSINFTHPITMRKDGRYMLEMKFSEVVKQKPASTRDEPESVDKWRYFAYNSELKKTVGPYEVDVKATGFWISDCNLLFGEIQ